MRTLITLNVGLDTIQGNQVQIHHAISAIQACGVSLVASGIVQGEWEGKPEQTLVLQGLVSDASAVGFRAQLYLAAKLLSQHCIAIYHDGAGELIGPNSQGWKFDESLFHFHANH